MTLAPTLAPAQGDLPPDAARLAHIQGNVSIQPYGTDGWGQAASNMPVGSGDRIYADQGAMGELQVSRGASLLQQRLRHDTVLPQQWRR